MKSKLRKLFSSGLLLFLLIILVFNNYSKGQQTIGQNPILNLENNLYSGDYIAKEQLNYGPAPGSNNSVTTYLQSQQSQQIKLYIDKNVQQPVNYLSESTSTNPFPQSESIDIAIDKTLPVGTLNGNPGVASSGEAIYSFNIYVPPGTNSMAPKIGISYNSSLKNGLIGRGWNLTGISSISRTSKDIFHDGLIEGIQLNTDDPLALDGNRLIRTAMGANTFRPERENFSLITDNGNYFIVQTNEGLIMTYGETSDSKLILNNNGNNVVLKWYLNKVTDAFGNYISYSYNNEGNEVTLKEIAYTGNSNANIMPYNSIKFYYDKRKDSSFSFIKGNELKQSLLLREVEIFCEFASMKRYKFNYVYKDQSFLREVTEYGADQTHLNSTLFKYGEGFLNNDGGSSVELKREEVVSNSGIVDDPVFTPGPINHSNYIVGDYNGDGRTDQMAISVDLTLNGGELNWELWLNDNEIMEQAVQSDALYPSSGTLMGFNYFIPSSFYDNDTSHVNFPGNSPPFFVINHSLSPINFAQSMDMNGDGMDDFIVATTSSAEITNLYIYYSNGRGFILKATWSFLSNKALIFSDLNGDGYIEGILYDRNTSSSNSAQFTVQFFDDQGMVNSIDNFTGSTTNHLTLDSNSDPLYKNFQMIDFDGDGIQEILATIDGLGIRIIKLEVVNNVLISNEIYASSNWNEIAKYQTQKGDFNGDGITDFFLPFHNSNRSVLFGTGDGYVFNNHNVHISQISPGFDNSFFVFDINDDGKDDIVNVQDQGAGYINFSAFLNGTGSSQYIGKISRLFYSNPNEFSGVMQVAFDHDLPKISIGDFDGDARMDFFVQHKGLTPLNSVYVGSSIVQFDKGTSYALLTSASNGLRNKTNFYYRTLCNGGKDVYLKGNNGSFPLLDKQIPIYVVTKMESPNGIGGIAYTTYKYEGLKFHRLGLGNLSFDKLSTYNSATNTKQIVEHNIPTSDTYYERTLHASKAFLVQGLGNSTSLLPLFERTYTTNYINLTQGRYFSFLAAESTADLISGNVSASSYTYDSGNNGILVNKHSTVNNSLSIIDETYVPYICNTGTWHPTKIQAATITAVRNNEASYSRTMNYEYDCNNGSLLKTVSDPGSSNMVTTNYSYEPNTGTLISKEVTATGLQSKTESFSYESKFRFPIASINVLGQKSESQFDSRWGAPTWSKSINGLINLSFYDGYGNLIKTIGPDNTISTTKKTWILSGEISSNHPFDVSSHALFSVSTKSSGSPSSKSYFDQIGRVILTSVDGFNKTIYSAKKFNSIGLETDATSTYDDDILNNNSSSKMLVTHNDYDEYNRIITSSIGDGVAAPLVSTISRSYSSSGSEILVYTDADGKITTKITDAVGLLLEVKDNSQTPLNYTYYSNGKLKSTTLAGTGIVGELVYDSWGRLISSSDKNSGTTTMTYNAYGLLTSRTNANTKTYHYNYDVANRLKTKTQDQDVFTYNYGDSGNDINSIKNILCSDGNKVEFEYDKFGRLLKKKETIVGLAEPLYSSYEYNSENQLQKYTYPGGFAVNYEYDSKGFKTKINRADNGAVIWKVDEVNVLGQFTKFTIGNQPQTINSFSNFGMPMSTNTSGIMNLSYFFDVKNGNMLQRKDELHNLTEDFTYDPLDRLLTVALNTTITKSFTYEANGNLSSQSDLGNYSYNANNKPNAVVSIEDPDALIDHALQEISYTAFDKVKHISEGDFNYEISYGCYDERKHSKLTNTSNNTLQMERYYSDGFELSIENGNTYQITYINSPSGLAAMYVKENANQNGTLYAVYTDNLGSLNMLVDENGNKLEQSFDAWGNARNPADWTTTSIPNLPKWLYRGYTGHEHLEQFGLINMNGRMYDPQIARFLSPDKLLQDPTNSQNYNGYSYCLNNPMKYSDPSGWAYMGYEYLPPLLQETMVAGDPQVGDSFSSNYYLDGCPISADEYRALVRSVGSINVKGVTSRCAGFETVLWATIHPENSEGSEPQLHYKNLKNCRTGIVISDISAEDSKAITGSDAWIGVSCYLDPPGTTDPNEDAQGSGGGNSSAVFWNNVNTGIGAFDVGQGAKGELINYAAKSSPAINDLKYVKGLKVLGGATFVASTVISGGLATNYYMNGGTNSSVGIKASLDIIMGGVGFLGPIGFGVSATYFLLDAGGAFGGYGDPLLTPKK